MSTPHIHKLSDFLRNARDAYGEEHDGKKMRFGQIIDDFREQGCALLLFIFALPAALPIPAIGINFIIALPLLLLTFQQMTGRSELWFPDKIQNKEVERATFRSLINKSIPYVEFIEIFTKPRLHFMTHGIARNIIGFFGLIMALSVCVPLPLTNTVPSFGIAAMALGILMRDGLAVVAGALIGTLWIFALCYFVFFFGTEGIDMMKEGIKSLL